MGIYVNPRNTAFRKALNADIYIDKTDLKGKPSGLFFFMHTPVQRKYATGVAHGWHRRVGKKGSSLLDCIEVQNGIKQLTSMACCGR